MKFPCDLQKYNNQYDKKFIVIFFKTQYEILNCLLNSMVSDEIIF